MKYNYTLTPLMQKWKAVYQHLNGFIEKQMRNKMPLKQCHKYSVPVVQKL